MNNWLKENVGSYPGPGDRHWDLRLFGLAFFLKVDGANEKVLFMVIGALSPSPRQW